MNSNDTRMVLVLIVSEQLGITHNNLISMEGSHHTQEGVELEHSTHSTSASCSNKLTLQKQAYQPVFLALRGFL